MHPPSPPFDPRPASPAAPGDIAPSPDQPPPRRRWRRSLPGEVIGWTIVIGLTLLVAGWHFKDAYFPSPPKPSDPKPTASEHRDITLEVFARYLVGAKELLDAVPERQVRTTLEPYTEDEATEFDRVRAAITLGELVGPDAALEQLDDLDADYANKEFVDPETREDIIQLHDLYTRGVGALTVQDRFRLVRRHDWFGELAASYGLASGNNHRDTALADARRTAFALFGAGAVLILAGLAALGLMITAIILLAHGRIRPALPAQLARVRDDRISPYLGVIACFMVVFIGLSFVVPAIPKVGGVEVGQFVMWLALLAALWPLARGTSFHDLRLSLGWHTGKGVAREIAAGVLGYLALLPIAGVGILLVVLISIIGESYGLKPQGHPAMQEISTDPKVMIPLYLLACVWAPAVEETMFRGGFFRYLRGVTHPVLAALIQGFFFAVIHPQGLVAVPALMALGFNFAMLREWRGSIIASMTAHALNNGFIFTMLFVAIG